MPLIIQKKQVLLIALATVLVLVVPVSATPVANFSGDPLNGRAPLNVTFTDLSTGGPPTGWAWFFGDENFSGKWTLVKTSAGWPSRFFQSCVVLPDGSIVLTGGRSLSGYLNDTWQSTDKGATWTRMSANGEWIGRMGHTSVAMPDGSVVLMGGRDVKGFLNDVWQSIDRGATWIQVKPNDSSGWSPRSYPGSVVLADGTILVMGGMASAGVVKNDVWKSTDNGTTWTCVNSSAGWRGRYGHSSLILPDGSIVVMGGKYHVYQAPMNDVWRSTDNGVTWTEIKPDNNNGWTKRAFINSIVLPDGSILVMGGSISDDAAENDIWRSTDNGATWVCTDAVTEWSPRYASGCVILPDTTIVLMGGLTSLGIRTDVWSLLPAGSVAQNPSHIYTAAGVYTVTLQVYDSNGSNSMQKPAYLNVAPPAPLITSLSPSTRPLGGVTFNLVVNGNYFTAASVVQWDGANKTTTFNSPTKLTAAIPAGDYTTSGLRAVTVIDPAGGISNTALFMVTDPLAPQLTSVNPKTGARNSTVVFTLAGKNFLSGAVVNFTNGTFTAPDGFANITADISSLTDTQIKGNVTFPVTAPLGKWNITVTDPVHGVSNIIQFTVINPPAPVINSIKPLGGARNSTVAFTLSGMNFRDGAVLNFTKSTYTAPDGLHNITATIDSLTPKQAKGNVTLPVDAPVGKWDVVISCPDSNPVVKSNYFTVTDPKSPTVGSVTPASGVRNTTVSFTLAGTNFGPWLVVNFTNNTYSAPDGLCNITATLSSITPKQAKGSVILPVDAPVGKWSVVVSVPDVAPVQKPNCYLVMDPKTPTLSGIIPTKGNRTTLLNFTLSGANFRSGVVVNFTNATFVALDGSHNVTTTVNSVTTNQVKGSVIFPSAAPTGKWDVAVTNPDTPLVQKAGVFTLL